VESTELYPEIEEEATTVLPFQQEVSSPAPAPTKQNETAVAAHSDDPKLDDSDGADPSLASPTEPTNSFVSYYGKTLEQDIKNGVESEVEGNAEWPVQTLIDEAPKAVQEALQQETDAAVQNTREAKTLEAEDPIQQQHEDDEPEPETVTDNIAVSSEVVESKSRPLPTVVSDLVSVIFNENRAITEQPITRTNLLALEQEHELSEIDHTTAEPTYEQPKHQVTKKQGVEDLLPELSPELVEESEGDANREERQLDQQDSKLNEVDAENAIDSDNVPSKSAKSEDDIEEEIEKRTEAEAKDEMESQVVGQSSSDDSVVEPADNEEDAAVPTENITTTETSVHVESSSTVKPVETSEIQDSEVETSEIQDSEGTEPTQVSPQASSVSETSEAALNVDGESFEEKEQEEDEAEQVKPTVQPENDLSSEEEEEVEEKEIADEPKNSSDDSTATPLVSYPPHDAGRTFDSNTADEHSAQVSGPSKYRSTLIIALCSGTAVIFIVVSLLIFMVSFHRQHGTLDIEMQEKRLGKGVQEEEDAQMKLLEVDLSKPVIVPIGNEETDECL
ncbi:hypothetical protein KR018_001516, partial [Drosophila ironensis]